MRKIEVLPSFPAYYVELKFDLKDRGWDLKEWLKELPGIKRNRAWDQLKGTWRVPASLAPIILREFEKNGFQVIDHYFQTDRAPLDPKARG